MPKRIDPELITRVEAAEQAAPSPAAGADSRITVDRCTQSDEEPIYQAWLPMVMSGACELLDIPRLHKQGGGLERKTARGGKDSIDHAPRMHDDIVNAAAGALVLVALRPTVFDWKAAGMTSAATWGDDDLGVYRI